jgi:hypothetical protein
VSEAKRNCGRVTDRGEEAWSEDVGPMNKKRIAGTVARGERANDREAPMAKAQWCRSAGRASKMDALTWGDLASCLKGRRWQQRSEESAEAVVVDAKPVKEPEVFVEGEGPNGRIG